MGEDGVYLAEILCFIFFTEEFHAVVADPSIDFYVICVVVVLAEDFEGVLDVGLVLFVYRREGFAELFGGLHEEFGIL